MRVALWEEVIIDLIRPREVKVGGQKMEFNALTCINTASNLVKLIRIDNKTAKHIHDKFSFVAIPDQCAVSMTREVSL
jgi:hypothetical protein